MREMEVRLRFDKHCLGQVRRFRWKRGKRQTYYLLPRNADGSRGDDHLAAIAFAAMPLIHYEEKIARKAFSADRDDLPRFLPSFPLPQDARGGPNRDPENSRGVHDVPR